MECDAMAAGKRTFEDQLDHALRLMDSSYGNEQEMGLKLLKKAPKDNGRGFGYIADKVKEGSADLEQALAGTTMTKEQLLALVKSGGNLYTEQQMREYGEHVAGAERARAEMNQSIMGDPVTMNGGVSNHGKAKFLLNKARALNDWELKFAQDMAARTSVSSWRPTSSQQEHLDRVYFKHGGRP
jgi:hypothetical protein